MPGLTYTYTKLAKIPDASMEGMTTVLLIAVAVIIAFSVWLIIKDWHDWN